MCVSTYFDAAESKYGNRLALSDPVSYRHHYVVAFSCHFLGFSKYCQISVKSPDHNVNKDFTRLNNSAKHVQHVLNGPAAITHHAGTKTALVPVLHHSDVWMISFTMLVL